MASNKTSYPRLTPSGSGHSSCFQSTLPSGVRKAKVQLELNLDRNVQTILLYSPPAFHPLWAPFLCLDLARSSLFIHIGFLAILPGYTFVGMKVSWTWNINQIFCFPFPSPPHLFRSGPYLLGLMQADLGRAEVRFPEACFSPSSFLKKKKAFNCKINSIVWFCIKYGCVFCHWWHSSAAVQIKCLDCSWWK